MSADPASPERDCRLQRRHRSLAILGDTVPQRSVLGIAALSTSPSGERGPASEFEHWWRRHGEWVEPANQRRGGESGVQRLYPQETHRTVLYSKRQTGHLYRSLLRPLGQPTVLREGAAYCAFERLGIRVPRLVFCAARKHAGRWQALLVTEALEGFISLDRWYETGMPERTDPAVQHEMLRQLALTLARLHRSRWQHGCFYPKHVFVRADAPHASEPPEIAFLDLEKSRRRLRVGAASRHDMRQFFRHWECIPAHERTYVEESYRHAVNARA